MEMNRRQFVTLTVGGLVSAAICGCAAEASGSTAAPIEAGASVDAGPASGFEKDGVYDRFKDRGFFVVKRGEELFAVSSICTHRTCKLKAQKDQSFLCPCHGSMFDPNGHVTRGPAKRDLPHYQTRVDNRGHLMVTLRAT